MAQTVKRSACNAGDLGLIHMHIILCVYTHKRILPTCVYVCVYIYIYVYVKYLWKEHKTSVTAIASE